MSPEVLARACEPFFTTKGPGKGSGLGLSQAYGLLRQSGGDLAIDSAPGRGTTVSLYLPRSRARPNEALATNPVETTRRVRPLRVLVVEDQPDVREVLVANLAAFGYRILESSSGEAGLGIIDSDPLIDLLIADYAMAGMNGVELVRWARSKRPGLPVVMMTGFVDISRIESQIDEVELLKKPYRRVELAAAI